MNRQRRRAGGGGSQPPGNLTPPTITRNGTVLTCDPGDWDNSPDSFVYQWTLNGTGVIGAISQKWSPPASAWSSLFGCQVMARNSAGQGMPALAQEVYIGVLDVLAVQPLAGQSLWRERAALTEALLVRNESNVPAAQDRAIGFSASGKLDLTALQSHCGIGTGFCPSWFSVTGNSSLNANQASAVNQPRIVGPGGVVHLFDGNPFLVATTANTMLSFNLPINGLAGATIIGVQATQSTQTDAWGIGAQNGGALVGVAESGTWGGSALSASTAGFAWRFGTGTSGNLPLWATPIVAGKTIVTSVSKKGVVEIPRLNGVAGPTYTAGGSIIANNGPLFSLWGPVTLVNNRIACWFLFPPEQTNAELLLLEQNLMARYPTT